MLLSSVRFWATDIRDDLQLFALPLGPADYYYLNTQEISDGRVYTKKLFSDSCCSWSSELRLPVCASGADSFR
jgi:hypothetical protein